MPKIKVNDIKMYYEIHGEGVPLILIMGLSGNVYWWDPPFIEELSKKFQTIIFDNRGVGRSDDPGDDVTIKMMADDTVGLMDVLNINSAHILGISMGGMIAQEIVLNYPEKVDKLILCSTNCGGVDQIPPSEEVMGLIMSFAQREHDRELVEEALSILFTEEFLKNNPDWIEKKIEDFLKKPTAASSFYRQLNAIMNFSAYERLQVINTPTLLMHGKKDILAPPKNSDILVEKIQGAKLVYFNNSAHWLFSHEPQLVVKTILEFLE